MRAAARIAALLAALSALAGCPYGDFFLPERVLGNSGIPEQFRGPAGDGWYCYRLSPAAATSDCVAYEAELGGWYGSVHRPAATNRVIAAHDQYLWFVPRPKGLSGKSGVVQIDTDAHEARLLGEFSADLPSERVNRVIARNDGTVWIATRDGAMNYDPALGRGATFDDWATFEQRGGGLERDYVLFTTTPSVLDVDERKHTILFATGDLFSFDQDATRWRRFDESYSAVQVDYSEDQRRYRRRVSWDVKDSRGRTKRRSAELEIVEVRERATYELRSSGKRDIVSDTIFDVLATDADIWMLTEHGVSQYDIAAKTYFSHVKGHSVWRRSERCDSYHDPSGTCVRKVLREERYDYPDTAPLLDVMATCATADRRGRVWFGFGGAPDGIERNQGKPGLMYFSDGRWTTVVDGPVVGRRVTDLAAYQDELFVATLDGVFRRSEGPGGPRWSEVRLDQRTRFSDALDLELDNRGRLWVATPQGVYGKRVIEGPIAWPPPAQTIRMPGF